MRSYNLNEQSASAAGMSSYINESGAYLGVMTKAEAITSKKETEGVEFTFQTDDGRTANYLQLWTHNKDGGELYGLKVLNAVMAVLGVTSITPRPMTLKDFEGASYPAQVFPELMNKQLGLVLQREEYEKTQGGIGNKLNIVLPYQASSGRTAGEMLQRRDAKAVDGLLKTLKDKTLTAKPAAAQSQDYGFANSEDPAEPAFY